MEKVFELKANYKLVKVPEEILPSIYCELKKLSIAENFQKIKNLIEKKDEKIILFLTKRLQDYNGNFKEYVLVEEKHNVVPLAFRNELAKQIALWTSTCTFEANYIAIWTDATAVSENDTTLGTEFLRGEFTKKDFTWNVAYLDKFFWSTEVWGQNLRELWIFVDWTASADSGFLMSHVNINENMSANETLTINVSITINSAT